MKRLLLLLLVSVFLLSGCIQTAPSYLVALTPATNAEPGRCTGSLLSARVILTAAHCARLERAVTLDGRATPVRPLVVDYAEDVAVLQTRDPLWALQYAHLGALDTTRPAVLYGACPFVTMGAGRGLSWQESGAYEFPGVADPLALEMWKVTRRADTQVDYACPGDSGGPLVQDGAVVGTLTGMDGDWLVPTVGVTLYASQPGALERALAAAQLIGAEGLD